MTPGALSYLDHQPAVHYKGIAADHAQFTQPNTGQQEYDLKMLLHERSEQRNPNLITRTNNIYAIADFSVPNQDLTSNSATATLTAKEMVQKIKDTFGLNHVQVANIVGISRPSLYNHITGKEVPKSLDAYQTFYDIAIQVEKRVGVFLKPGLKSILVNGKTLLAHLKDRDVDSERIIDAALEVAKKLEQNNGTAPLSSSQQRIASRAITKAG